MSESSKWLEIFVIGCVVFGCLLFVTGGFLFGLALFFLALVASLPLMEERNSTATASSDTTTRTQPERTHPDRTTNTGREANALRETNTAQEANPPRDANTDEALAVLRTRYARGELSDAQFERKLERLLGTETVEDAEEFVDDGRRPRHSSVGRQQRR
jgi:hypothetical protein